MFSYVEKKLQIALTDSPHPPKRMTVKDVVQSLSCVHLFLTPWALALQTSLSFTISRSLLKFISIVLVVLSNHLILCRPPLLLPSAFPSIRVFSNESALGIEWPKYWSFSISSSNEYSGLISFRIDQLDLPAVLGSPDSQEAFPAPQFKSINSSAFSLLYGLTCTSVYDYWKNQSTVFISQKKSV